MTRPCTVGAVSAAENLAAYPRFHSLGTYAVDTTDAFGDASDLNAAPPPPAPAPPPPNYFPLILGAGVVAWLFMKGNF